MKLREIAKSAKKRGTAIGKIRLVPRAFELPHFGQVGITTPKLGTLRELAGLPAKRPTKVRPR